MSEVLSIDLSDKPYRSYLVQCSDPPTLLQKHEVVPEEGEDLPALLSRLVEPFEKTYQEAVVFVSSPHYHSLAIHLPFSDPKKVTQVLPGMIQDLLPFELDDFLTSPTVSKNGTSTSSYVHVGVIDKHSIEKTFLACKALKLDPVLIAPSTSALQALIPKDAAERVMIVVSDNETTNIGVFSNRRLIADRIVRSEPAKQIISSMLQTTPVEEVYWFGENCVLESARQLPMPSSAREFLSVCGATLGALPDSNSLPVNFRVGKFRLLPRFGLLLRSLTKAKKAAFWALMVFVTLIAARFFTLNFSEDSLEDAIVEQVQSAGLSAGEDPAADLRNATLSLERQLQGLGSIQQLSPVEILAMVSKDIPSTAGVQIQVFEVKEGGVILEGTAPEYQSIERLKKEFDKKRSTYCSVRLSNVNDQRGRKVFRFDLVICEKSS